MCSSSLKGVKQRGGGTETLSCVDYNLVEKSLRFLLPSDSFNPLRSREGEAFCRNENQISMKGFSVSIVIKPARTFC